MNVLHLLNVNKLAAVELNTLAVVIYTFLLTNVSKDDCDLYCVVSTDDIYSKFSAENTDENMQQAMQLLVDHEFVEITIINSQHYFIVGTYNDKVMKLFSPDATDKFDIVDAVETFIAEAAPNNTSARVNRVLRNAAEQLRNVLAKDLNKLNQSDYMDFFSGMFATYYEEPIAEYVGRDFGQMKTLIRLFDAPTLLHLIFEYIKGSTKYTKNLATIGDLVYKRNDVLSTIKKTATRSKSTASNKKHDDF